MTYCNIICLTQVTYWIGIYFTIYPIYNNKYGKSIIWKYITMYKLWFLKYKQHHMCWILPLPYTGLCMSYREQVMKSRDFFLLFCVKYEQINNKNYDTKTYRKVLLRLLANLAAKISFIQWLLVHVDWHTTAWVVCFCFRNE